MEFTVQVKVAKDSMSSDLEQIALAHSSNGNGNGTHVSLATLSPNGSRVQGRQQGMYLIKVRMRSRLTSSGVRLLLDRGSDDPEAVKLAIMALSAVPIAYNRHSWAVLGEMNTPQNDAVQAHRLIGNFCAEHYIDRVLCIGPMAMHIASGAIQRGIRPEYVQAFRTSALALNFLRENILPGDVLLIKGASSMKLEQIAEELCAS